MIFGKTWQQKQEEEQAYLRSIQDGVKWFAWYPVRLENGSWVWLEWVKLHYGVYEGFRGTLCKFLTRPIYYLWEEE